MKSENCPVASYTRCWQFGGMCEFHQLRNFFLNNFTTPHTHYATISPGRCCPSHSRARTAPVSPSRDPQESPAECVFTKNALVSLNFKGRVPIIKMEI